MCRYFPHQVNNYQDIMIDVKHVADTKCLVLKLFGLSMLYQYASSVISKQLELGWISTFTHYTIQPFATFYLNFAVLSGNIQRRIANFFRKNVTTT